MAFSIKPTTFQVLMTLLALSSERPMSGYIYPVPDNPLVLPARRSKTTTTAKPEEAGNTGCDTLFGPPYVLGLDLDKSNVACHFCL